MWSATKEGLAQSPHTPLRRARPGVREPARTGLQTGLGETIPHFPAKARLPGGTKKKRSGSGGGAKRGGAWRSRRGSVARHRGRSNRGEGAEPSELANALDSRDRGPFGGCGDTERGGANVEEASIQHRWILGRSGLESSGVCVLHSRS